MERTTRAAVLPVAYGWSDVGSWNGVWELSEQDAAGNAATGAGRFCSTRAARMSRRRNSWLRSRGRGPGRCGDRRCRAGGAARDGDGLRRLVHKLKEMAPAVTEEHLKVHRPWGSYQSVDNGERFQVKRIVVKPGGRLSLQAHHHRAEHWVVVRGTARVTIGDEIKIVHENESIYIPIGVRIAWKIRQDRP